MSIILAKILGLYFIAIGLAFLLQPQRLKKILPQMMLDENFLFLGGLFALIFGAFIISVHNIWVLGWPVIITILGWWSLIKGFALVVHPGFIKLFSFMHDRSNLFYRGISVIYLVLGVFLFCKGFF